MKTKITIISVIALAVSACTTGSYVTTSYVDDIYFNPGDVPPPVIVEKETVPQERVSTKSADRLILSEINENEDGSKTMNNYIFDDQDAGEYVDAQLYNMDQMNMVGSDTTYLYDDDQVKYVINNYYDGADMDFAYRIRRFHRPYFYDPFYWDSWYWDSWYYPYSSLSWSWGWGWDYWGWGYTPWYGGYGYSPYYSYWNSPWSYYGWNYPYYSWYSPHHHYWGGGNYNSGNYRYERRADRNTNVLYGTNGLHRGNTTVATNPRTGLKSSQPVVTDPSATDHSSRRARSVSGAENGGRSVRSGEMNSSTSGRTLTEMRRTSPDNATPRSRYSGTTVNRNTGATPARESGIQERRSSASETVAQPSSNVRRSGTVYTRPTGNTVRDGAGNTPYTPSYSQQRSATRSNYNVQNNYTRPSTGNSENRVVTKSAENQSNYSQPSNNSSYNRTYRSSSTYNRSSSMGTSSSGRSYQAPSNSSNRSSSSPSYNAPSRSSSPSYSAPSRSNSSSGGASHSSGGSSGGSSSGSSSSGGRSGRR